MAKKNETPFNKIMSARGKLRLYVEYGEAAIPDQTPQEFAAEVLEAFDIVMAFRNIINSMVSFNQSPEMAALGHIPTDLLEGAMK